MTRGSQSSKTEIERNNEASGEASKGAPRAGLPRTNGDSFRAFQCCRGCCGCLTSWRGGSRLG